MRIEEVNLILHAVTEINPESLAIAAALDAERANGTVRSPLWTPNADKEHRHERPYE